MKVVVDIPEVPKNDKQRWALANGTPYAHGEWKIYVNLGGTLMRQCMNCGHEFNDNGDAKNFCPNCGADMRKEGEAE